MQEEQPWASATTKPAVNSEATCPMCCAWALSTICTYIFAMEMVWKTWLAVRTGAASLPSSCVSTLTLPLIRRAVLRATWPLPDLSPVIGRAIIMPNLVPPVTTTAMAVEYRERILSASDGALRKRGFQPLMTLYLTDDTTAAEIDAAVESGVVFAVKLYPAGATTNSASGVTDVRKAFPALQRMAELGLPLCVHGEVTDPAVDVFDREEVFLSSVLPTVVDAFPKLKVVVEHCTTKAAVEFVRDAGPNVAATITPQHLLYDRNGACQARVRSSLLPRVPPSCAVRCAQRCSLAGLSRTCIACRC